MMVVSGSAPQFPTSHRQIRCAAYMTVGGNDLLKLLSLGLCLGLCDSIDGAQAKGVFYSSLIVALRADDEASRETGKCCRYLLPLPLQLLPLPLLCVEPKVDDARRSPGEALDALKRLNQSG